jgi:hypothetical protein
MRQVAILFLAACLLFPVDVSTPAKAEAPVPQMLRGPEIVIYADEQPSTLNIPAPDFGPRLSSANFYITYLSEGTPDGGYICQATPAEVQNALEYAAAIWETQVNSSVPIRMSVCWTFMGSGGILGSAGPFLTIHDSPYPGYWYPFALADSRANADLWPDYYDIVSRFNSGYANWYYGTAGAPPPGKMDLVSVALHELGHGLGFIGSMSNASGPISYDNPPLIFDRFTENSAGQSLVGLPNGGSALSAALTSAAYFDGPNANTANGGQRVPLYTPSVWLEGSSYSHVAESYNGTPNALMTYSINIGEVVHNPGPVILGVLKDIGWSIVALSPTTPTNLSASPASASQINLSWNDSLYETGYQIDRSTNNADWVQVGAPGANATSFQNSGLSGGTRYYYRVRAVNSTGSSNYTTTVNAITLGAPPAPSELTAFGAGLDRIQLNWKDNSNVETGFIIERYNGVSWSTLPVTPANTTAYLDTGLSAGTAYTYRLRADWSTDSNYSNQASGNTWAQIVKTFLPRVEKR